MEEREVFAFLLGRALGAGNKRDVQTERQIEMLKRETERERKDVEDMGRHV